MTVKNILLATLLACAFAPALADEPVRHRIVTHADAGFPGLVGGMPLIGPVRMHAKPVKNAPYSAEVITERRRSLADGNEIVREHSTMSYRDNAGRTRTEVRDADGQVRAITIHDPVERVTFLLRPETKTATRIEAGAEMARAAREQARASREQARAAGEQGRAAAEQARAHVEQLRKEGKLVEHTTGPDGERIIIKRIERAERADRAERAERAEERTHARGHEEVRIRALAQAEKARELRAHLGPMIAEAAGDRKWKENAQTKELGTREFNGVKASCAAMRSRQAPSATATRSWSRPSPGTRRNCRRWCTANTATRAAANWSIGWKT